MNEALKRLDITDKQSLIDCLFAVQGGNVSCRRLASEIVGQVDAVTRESELAEHRNCDGDTLAEIRAAWTGPGSVEMECKVTGWQGVGRADMIEGDVTGFRVAGKHTVTP